MNILLNLKFKHDFKCYFLIFLFKDGQWGAWSNFSTCSALCGNGTQVRSRLCNNPAPQNGGANCTVNNTSTQSCDSGNCPPIGKKIFIIK